LPNQVANFQFGTVGDDIVGILMVRPCGHVAAVMILTAMLRLANFCWCLSCRWQ